MGYISRHDEATPDSRRIEFTGLRDQAIWSITRTLMGALRYERVRSEEDSSLDRQQIAPHLTYVIATNAPATVVWRYDIDQPKKGSTWVAVLDVAF